MLMWFVIIGLIIGLAIGFARYRQEHPKKAHTARTIRTLTGSGDFDYEIVGEASYQDSLFAIAGQNDEAASHLCEARLWPEPHNPHDRNAIRVEIDDRVVGYIPRNQTAAFHEILNGRSAICEAEIVGGWDRGERGRGHFGVKLDIDWPLRFDD
ncbi:MAG: HIRAN domain-containing protein [Parvibaculaceae bacterium]